METDLGFITYGPARNALIEAGYDTLEKAYAAGEEAVVGLRYVSTSTWEAILAEREGRKQAAEVEAGLTFDEKGDPPPGEPAELPLPPVVYEPPGDPAHDDPPPSKPYPHTYPPLGDQVDEPTYLDMSPYFQSERADFDSKLLTALDGEGSLEAAYGAIEDSLIAQRDDGIGNVAGVEVDELMRSYVASLTLLRERGKAPLLQALLMGWIRQAVDLGLVPDVSEWVRTSAVPSDPSPALVAFLPYEQVYLEPPAEPWPVR